MTGEHLDASPSIRWSRVLLATVALGLPAWTLGAAAWLVAHPDRAVAATRGALAEAGWLLAFDGGTFDRGEGWGSPGTWTWRFDALEMISLRPARPTILLSAVQVGLPRPGWGPHGPALVVSRAQVGTFSLHFEEVVVQAEPPPAGLGGIGFVVQDLTVGRFGLTMREGRGPAVVADAEDVTLVSPFEVRPTQRTFYGGLALGRASVDVAGVAMQEVVPRRIAFTGLGLEIDALARLGEVEVDARLAVSPLIGPPGVEVHADLRDATLHAVADALMGPGDLEVLGRVRGRVELLAGGHLGPARLEGTATIDVRDAGFSKPEAGKALVSLAVNLAPFLHYDGAGNVVVGDLHGGVSFTEQGVSFDSLSYEAPHSVGDLRGYVGRKGLSAKLHFHPRQDSGAIEWGFVLRGEVRRPKVALALPHVLRDWTPCEDPLDCPLVGGPSRSRGEASR